MSYDEFVSDVVQAVEAVGAGIMVVGGIGSLVYFAFAALRADDRAGHLLTDCGECSVGSSCSASRS